MHTAPPSEFKLPRLHGVLSNAQRDMRGRVRLWDVEAETWIVRDPVDAVEFLKRGICTLEAPSTEAHAAPSAEPQPTPAAPAASSEPSAA